jgi:hypothetical protein
VQLGYALACCKSALYIVATRACYWCIPFRYGGRYSIGCICAGHLGARVALGVGGRSTVNVGHDDYVNVFNPGRLASGHSPLLSTSVGEGVFCPTLRHACPRFIRELLVNIKRHA